MLEQEPLRTFVKSQTGEECGLQKPVIDLHDDARLGCRVPDSIDNEHPSPENPPMGETQADEGNHDVFLPFPKCDTVWWIRLLRADNKDRGGDRNLRPNHQRGRRGKDGHISR